MARGRHSQLILYVIVATLIAGLIAACGSPETTPSPTTGADATPTPTDSGDAGSTATPTGSGSTDPSFDAAAFFSGKTIQVVAPWGPGNNTDAHARAIVQFMGAHIPGNPELTIVNKEGAAGTTGGNWFHNNAKPDGTWLLVNTGANPLNQITRLGVTYDFRDFTPIGGIMQRPAMWIISGDAPYDRIDEAMGGTESFTVGLNTQADVTTGKVVALAEWLDLPVEPSYGIGTGFAEFLQNFDRSDTDSFVSGSAWGSTAEARPGWWADGYIEPFFAWGPKASFPNNSEIDLPEDVPFPEDILTPEQRFEWNVMAAGDEAFYRGVYTVNGTDENAVQVLRDAFQKMMNEDQGYRDVYERLVAVQPELGGTLTAEEIQTALDEFFSDLQASQDVFRKYLPAAELPPIQ